MPANISPEMAIKLLHTQRGNPEGNGNSENQSVKDVMKLASEIEKQQKQSYEKRNLLKNFGPLIEEVTKRVKGNKNEADLTSIFEKIKNIQDILGDSTSKATDTARTAAVKPLSSTTNVATDSKTIKTVVSEINSNQKNSTNSIIESQKTIAAQTRETLSSKFSKSLIGAKDWIVNKVSKMTPPWVSKFVIGPMKTILGGVMKISTVISKILLNLAISTLKIIFSIISFLVTGVLLPIFSFMFTSVVLPIMGMLGTVLSVVATGVTTILAAIMPVLLPILGIAALIFLIVYLISSNFRNWVDDAIIKVWDWLKNNVWGWLTNFATHISEWWASLWQPHSGFWAWLGSNLWTWWTEVSQSIAGLVVDGILKLGEWAWSFIEYLADGAQRLWNYLKTVPYLGAALEWVAETFKKAWGLFVGAFDWVKDNILTPLWNLVEPFVTWVKEKIGQLLEWVFGLLPEGVKEDFDAAKARGSGNIAAAAHAGAAYFDLAFSSSSYMKETIGIENPPDAMSIKKLYAQQRALEAMIIAIMQFPDDTRYILERGAAAAKFVNSYGDGPLPLSESQINRMVQGIYNKIVSGGLDLSYYEEVTDPSWNRSSHIGTLFDVIFNPENEDGSLPGLITKSWRSVRRAIGIMKDLTGRNDVIPYDFLREAWGYDQISDAVQSIWAAEKGMIVRVAEAGDDEAIIPLNERGIEFMRGTIESALQRVDLPPVSLSDSEHKNMEAKFDEIKEAIVGMGAGLSSAMKKIRVPAGQGDADKTKADEQLQINRMLSRGKVGGNGGRI